MTVTTELALGIDLGGTNLTVALVDGAHVLARRSDATPTGRGGAAIVDALRAATDAVLAEAAISRQEIAGAGVAVAGLVDAARSRVTVAPNIGLRDVPLAADLARALGMPVALDNDSNAAAWGEFRHGAGQGLDECLVVTVGTGIGAGIVLEGRLRRGGTGAAGEIGHLCVDRGGLACKCGKLGCLEQYASGSALVRNVLRTLHADHGDHTAGLRRRVDASPAGLTGSMVTAAARSGDEFARAQIAEVGRWLGLGLAEAVTLLDVSVVIVGGGVGSAGDLLLGPAADALHQALVERSPMPEVVVRPAALGNDAGVVGAADLVLQVSPARVSVS